MLQNVIVIKQTNPFHKNTYIFTDNPGEYATNGTLGNSAESVDHVIEGKIKLNIVFVHKYTQCKTFSFVKSL